MQSDFYNPSPRTIQLLQVPHSAKAKKNMCVSDHMGIQNRVGRSGFFFAIFLYCP